MTESTQLQDPTGPAYQLREKVAALADTILSKHPSMPTLLREIHTTLSKYPEQVSLLEESEIQIIVSGLSVQTNVAFAAAATKAPAVKNLTSKLKSLGGKAAADMF
jgi:hypothetical protein